MLVLVVDDSRVVRRLVENMLRQLGCDVIAAENGLDALARLEALASRGSPLPDAALIDWNMPEMNGLELIRALRAADRYAGLKIVMATTETEMCQVVLALEAGADEYAMKPFNQEIIADKLRLVGLEV